MSALIDGFAPVFLMIALGWGLKASGFLTGDAWKPVERLTYFVFYPAFLIPAIWQADFSGGAAGVVGLATLAGAMTLALAAFLVRPLLRLDGPAYTSVFQGVIRWNGFVFIPVAAAVFGQGTVGLAAVALGSLVPSINLVCVLVLSKWGAGQGGGWRAVGRSLWINPVVWSCVIGTALNLTGLAMPAPLVQPTAMLGGAAIVLGLIVAGAGLSFRDAAGRPVTVGAVTAIKLLVVPLVMAGFAHLLGADRTAFGIVLLAGATPGAAASYVLARQMGGDAPLMASVVAFTTVGAVVTMPLLLWLFGYL
ncbi:MAG: AEC family transporter [Brevundimonas sp.]|uniref:AEC family transporter n=1 Tax=Brevundimonas sp. TaxID=1871086 RepID=UPI0025BAB84A|nr:AEC family transporter [Brevundimonas sp.]MBX3476367.1 AEC family transporter [Brevundimonas sp.]